MAQPQTDAIARERARQALGGIDAERDSPIVMHLGSYRTSTKGRSVRATIGDRFASAHGMVGDEEIDQFYDPETQALIILPKGAIEDRFGDSDERR